MKVKRDCTKIDSATDKPFCYGNESARDVVCLMCRFSTVCREVTKMKVAPPEVLPSVADDLIVDQYDDMEDDDGNEA